MYADDHQICASHQLIDNVVTLLNNEAEIVTDWYKKNFLLANKDKFQAMFLASKAKNTQEVQIVIDNEEIECTSSLNLLGVLIDNKLNFSEHIQQVCQKANCKTGVLSRMKNLVPERTKLHLFKAVILPKLNYCSLVWLFLRASDQRKLERIQEKGLRAVFKDSVSTYENLLKKARLPTLRNRRLQDLMVLMFNVKNGLSPKYISELFQTMKTNYNLRTSDFVTPRYNTVTYGKHSIRYLGPYLWRKLPGKVRTQCDLNSFKRQIKKMDLESFLLEKCPTGCFLCYS